MKYNGREFHLCWEVNPKSTPVHLLKLKDDRPVKATIASQTAWSIGPKVVLVEAAIVTEAAETRRRRLEPRPAIPYEEPTESDEKRVFPFVKTDKEELKLLRADRVKLKKAAAKA